MLPTYDYSKTGTAVSTIATCRSRTAPAATAANSTVAAIAAYTSVIRATACTTRE
jgi:hypothetical protein